MKEWREKKYVFLLFLLIWKDRSFAYIPLKKRDQNQCSSPQNFHLVVWIDFKVLKMGFLEGMRDLKV